MWCSVPLLKQTPAQVPSHFVKADLAEARQEIANISAALLEGEEEEAEGEGLEEGADQLTAG